MNKFSKQAIGWGIIVLLIIGFLIYNNAGDTRQNNAIAQITSNSFDTLFTSIEKIEETLISEDAYRTMDQDDIKKVLDDFERYTFNVMYVLDAITDIDSTLRVDTYSIVEVTLEIQSKLDNGETFTEKEANYYHQLFLLKKEYSNIRIKQLYDTHAKFHMNLPDKVSGFIESANQLAEDYLEN